MLEHLQVFPLLVKGLLLLIDSSFSERWPSDSLLISKVSYVINSLQVKHLSQGYYVGIYIYVLESSLHITPYHCSFSAGEISFKSLARPNFVDRKVMTNFLERTLSYFGSAPTKSFYNQRQYGTINHNVTFLNHHALLFLSSLFLSTNGSVLLRCLLVQQDPHIHRLGMIHQYGGKTFRNP